MFAMFADMYSKAKICLKISFVHCASTAQATSPRWVKIDKEPGFYGPGSFNISFVIVILIIVKGGTYVFRTTK